MDSEGLERFVNAQERDYGQALREIKRGRKESHWMWYIFPQIQGLGHSPTAQYYAIRDWEEAEDYMRHPVLGSRLLEISGELLKLESSDAGEVFGWPDNMKLKSSMTLFEMVSGQTVFGKVLDKFFGGERDEATLKNKALKAPERTEKPEETTEDNSVYRNTASAYIIRESAEGYSAVSEKNSYTLEDYYALPEDTRVELIDGQFFKMLAPSLIHQAVSGELMFRIQSFIRKKKGNCVVYAAPVDVQLDCDDRTMVEPDVVVVCDRDKLNRRCIMGAPDFVAEILSPSTKNKDMFLKLMKYKDAGVKEYWMIDTEKERVITYCFEEDDIPVIYGMDSQIPVRIFDGELVIDLAEIKEAYREIGE